MPGARSPLPLFSDLFITKELKAGNFGSVHSEGVTGAFHGSAHSGGFSSDIYGEVGKQLVDQFPSSRQLGQCQASALVG